VSLGRPPFLEEKVVRVLTTGAMKTFAAANGKSTPDIWQ